MAARPGTFRSSYGPKGGHHHVQYSDLLSENFFGVHTLLLDIEVMNETALSDPDLEKTAKTLAEECCANNLLKWASDNGFKIHWLDGDEQLCSKMQTFNELTQSEDQELVPVGMTLAKAGWMDDVVDKESWMSQYNAGTTSYAVAGHTQRTETGAAPSAREKFVMMVTFKQGAK